MVMKAYALYESLREKLDTMGIGFPPVPGKDIAYLKKMFTEEHAKVFLAMEERFQPVAEIAEKLGKSPEDVEQILKVMDAKALVASTGDEISPVFYIPVPWLPGWGDWGSAFADRETAQLEYEYREEAEFKGPKGSYRRNVFRTIPIKKSISAEETKKIGSYDDIKKIVERAEKISVGKCYCDLWWLARGGKETEIYEPLERCLAFNKSAEFTVRKGVGRYITHEECLDILNKCAESGLVHNIGDIQGAEWICNCGDHCGSNLSRRNVPWKFADYEKTSNYYVGVESDTCTGCGVCIDKCWFDAVVLNSEQVAEINASVCEGCGQCVTACPTSAITLKKREKNYIPPARHPHLKTSEEYISGLARYADIIKIKKT